MSLAHEHAWCPFVGKLHEMIWRVGKQVAAFQCLQPFFGTLLAFFILNERPTVWDIGGVGVLVGLVVVVREASGKEAKL